ncbi:hypothetical protein [Methylobacterium oxalidis]|uniref:hypothetical protein n=1 Tax=Methylobacterium oxalidis TaxID=944322 RepID=UPI0033163ABF
MRPRVQAGQHVPARLRPGEGDDAQADVQEPQIEQGARLVGRRGPEIDEGEVDPRPLAKACLVWELTGDGAIIEIEPEAFAPDGFRLESPDLSLDETCRVTHRAGRKLTVRFAG